MNIKSIHHADLATIERMYNDYPAVFILTTGRSGSKFLASLLDQSPNIRAFHEPRPTLEFFSHFASTRQEQAETLTHIIDTARMESILEVFITEKIYVESNQCLTFFAPFIARLFKASRFVHVVRHPGDFVRSAIRKGWHKNDSIWEAGRVKIQDEIVWNEMDQVERLAWTWNTTNAYIESFRKTLTPQRFAFFKIEDLFNNTNEVSRMINFIGGNQIPTDTIIKIQNTPINELMIGPDEPPNMKKVEHYPKYRNWDNLTKMKLRSYTNTLAEGYGYDLS